MWVNRRCEREHLKHYCHSRIIWGGGSGLTLQCQEGHAAVVQDKLMDTNILVTQHVPYIFLDTLPVIPGRDTNINK